MGTFPVFLSPKLDRVSIGFPWVKMKPINLLLFLLLFFSGQIQGSTEMIQTFLPTGKESPISLPIDKLPENSTVLLLDHLNRTIAIYYPNGETKVEPPFEGKVKISGLTCLTFQSPQKSDSGVYFAKVIRDQIQTIKFNITFQDQNTDTTVAAPVSLAVSAFSPAVSAVLAVLAIIAAAAAAAAVVLWRYLKKKCQDQKEAELFSANSGTNSPYVQILLPPPQDNGDPHLIEENTVEIHLFKAALKTTDRRSVLHCSPLSTTCEKQN